MSALGNAGERLGSEQCSPLKVPLHRDDGAGNQTCFHLHYTNSSKSKLWCLLLFLGGIYGKKFQLLKFLSPVKQITRISKSFNEPTHPCYTQLCPHAAATSLSPVLSKSHAFPL